MSPQVIDWLNRLDQQSLAAELKRCCGSSWWCTQVAKAQPFADGEELIAAADRAFDAMPDDAWLEAIRSHPRIGDFESLKMKYAGNRDWSEGEQAGAAVADDETLRQLAAANDAYEERFGYLFVVCATGKSAREMLDRLNLRLSNDPARELSTAAAEQRTITHLRLAKLRPQDAGAKRH